jgi:uncharacterized integral membrane protein
MKRWLTIIIGALVVLVALLFSAANLERIALDLYFAEFTLPAGVLVLGAVLIGAVLAGSVLYLGVIVPLRLKLAGTRRQLDRAASK